MGKDISRRGKLWFDLHAIVFARDCAVQRRIQRIRIPISRRSAWITWRCVIIQRDCLHPLNSSISKYNRSIHEKKLKIYERIPSTQYDPSIFDLSFWLLFRKVSLRFRVLSKYIFLAKGEASCRKYWAHFLPIFGLPSIGFRDVPGLRSLRDCARGGEDVAGGIIRETVSRIQSFARGEQWTRLMGNGVNVGTRFRGF